MPVTVAPAPAPASTRTSTTSTSMLNMKCTMLCIVMMGGLLYFTADMSQFHSLRFARQESGFTTKDKVAVSTSSPPMAILHFGPRKTATTTIQAWLKALSDDTLLPNDNLKYRGHDEFNFGEGPSQYLRNLEPSLCVSRTIKSRSVSYTSSSEANNQGFQGKHIANSTNGCQGENTVGEAFYNWTHHIRQDATVHGYHVLFSDEDIPYLQSQYNHYNRWQQQRQRRRELLRRKMARTSPPNTTVVEIYATLYRSSPDPPITKFHPTLLLLRDKVFPDYYSNGNIQVTATYRRYFDWLYSEYQEQIKTRTIFHSSLRPVLGFVEWYRLFREIQEYEEAANYDQLEKESDRYDVIPYFLIRPLLRSDILEWEETFNTTVAVFNMHEGPKPSSTSFALSEPLPLPLRWLCEMIPDIAKQTCKQAHKKELKIDGVLGHHKASDKFYRARRIGWHVISSHQLNLSRSARFAYRQNASSRLELLQDIQAHLDKQIASQSGVPVTCLSDKELQHLYQTSITIQNEVVPDYHRKGSGQKDIDEAWDRSMKSGKFCDVDVEKILRRKSWRKYFAALEDKISRQVHL